MLTDPRSRWGRHQAASRATWRDHWRRTSPAVSPHGREGGDQPLFAGRRHLPIHGPLTFRAATRRLLGELRQRAPRRYREVLDYFPQAVYTPEIAKRQGFAGRADGLFGLDGADYPSFRKVFLHEVGHCVGRTSMYDPYTNEREADAYAERVLGELGA